MHRFEGKVGFVSGGGTGIGLACAKAIAAGGGKVMLAGRRENVVREAAAQIGPAADWIACDVTSDAAVEAAVAATCERLGPPRLAVNSAGTAAGGNVLNSTAAELMATLDTNVAGTFRCMRAQAKAMKAAGGGSIVNISSIAATLTHRWMTAYCVSKAGVNMLTACAADDLGEYGIRVNAVMPSLVPTDMAAPLVNSPRQREGIPASHAAGAPRQRRRRRQPGGVSAQRRRRLDHRSVHPGRRRPHHSPGTRPRALVPPIPSRGTLTAASRAGAAALPRFDRLPLVVLPLALTAIVWLPITGNYFYQDDFLFLYRVVNSSWPEFLLAPHGGHLLIARNAIFWLFHTLFATAAGWYFCVVLLTHLLNVYLLFAVIRAHTGSAPLACFGAALWGTCVVNEGALGWYSVYGQVLVATAMLWLLRQFAAIDAGAALPRFAWARWSLLLLFAATCFGIGVAVAGVAPLLAWLLLRSTPARATAVRHLAVAAVITVLVYAGVSQLHASLYGGANSLTSLLAALQRPDLVGGFTTLLALCGVTDLVLGVFAPALAHPYPTIALVGTPILLAGVAAILLYAPAARARIAADFALLLACYGSIALGRALLADGPLVFGAVEPRYQYAALVPVTLLLCEILRPAAALLGRAQTPVCVAAGVRDLATRLRPTARSALSNTDDSARYQERAAAHSSPRP